MRALLLIPSFLLAVTITAHAEGQTASPAASAVIAEVHASGAGHFSDAQIAAAAGLKPGDTVTREQIQAAADQLTSLGVFSLVNYRFSTLGSKITVNFELKEAPRVPVSFDNFPWVTDAEFTAAIHQTSPLFDGTVPTDGAELDQISTAITETLKSRGITGTVQHRLVAHPTRDGVMLMQFSIEGADAIVDSIDFGDGLARDSQQLHDRQQDLLHKPFSRFSLEIFEYEQVRPLYLASGHLRVEFGEPVVHLTSTGSQSPSKVSVTLQITPNPVYTIESIEWKGVTAVPAPTLASLLAVKSGEQADGMRLASTWQRFIAEYQHRGYINAKLDPEPAFDYANDKVSYLVTVDEGPQFHMGELVLTGLSQDAEDHLRYAWKLPKGAVFDGAYYDSMLTKLAKPSAELFGELPVHYTELGHFLRVNPENNTADVLLDFK